MTDSPTRVLTDDEVDLLELVLGDALPPSALVAALVTALVTARPAEAVGGDVVLTDAENTPLARLTTGPDGQPDAVEPLRPLATATGPQWDAGLRRPAREVRADLRATPGADDGRVGLLVTELPTREESDAAADLVAGAANGPVLLLVPVARRAPAPGGVGAPGLVRSALGLAGDLAERTGATVTTVVVPWSGPAVTAEPGGAGGASEPGGPAGAGGPTLAEVAAAYGANRVETLTAHRSPATAERVAALPGVRDDAVRALYPPASAAEVLRAASGTRRQGVVVFFTGLSGSGKSTVARALAAELEDDGLGTTLLDGDEVRHHLSKGLGFDRESRETNVERIGYVAALVARHGGIAVAAPIAPFATGRARVRALAEEAGARFVLVHISTPLAVCEARDRKGLYARARAGEIAEFTGISSPYEEPDDAELVIDTTDVRVPDAVRQVRAHLTTLLG